MIAVLNILLTLLLQLLNVTITLYFSYIVICALLMTSIMLFVSTDDNDDNCLLVFFFYSFPLLCIALCVTLTCMNGSKLTLQCIFFKCTQLEWQRCSSSLPTSLPPPLNPGLLPSGGCPAVPGSSCRRPGGVRLRPRPGPQESPAAGRDGGGRHEVSPQRWAWAIRPDARPLPPAFCSFTKHLPPLQSVAFHTAEKQLT